MEYALTKDELIARLKDISTRKVPKELDEGAMCYETTICYDQKVKCQICGHYVLKDTFFCDERKTITEIVKHINQLGYDAKTEFRCEKCMQKVFNKQTDSGIIFYFKAKGDKSYHKTVSDDSYDYMAVSALLEDEETREANVPEFINKMVKVINSQQGDTLPVSAFKGIEDGTWPQGTAKYEKRGIAAFVPKWESDNCIQCNRLQESRFAGSIGSGKQYRTFG